MPALSELPIMSVSDCRNVRIMLDELTDPAVFFLKDVASANDDHYWMPSRTLDYIQVISEPEQVQDSAGRTVLQTTLADGRFAVVPARFFTQVQSFLQLKRNGIKWKSAGKEVNAAIIKKKIQDALLPFRIPEKEITALYKQLQTFCYDSETIVEPGEAVDLRSKVYARPPFIVDRFMCPGLTLFAAPSKTGKSFLALDLACCVAEGKPFWGFQTSAGAVLYLALEDSEWRIQDRLVKVGRKDQTDLPEGLDVWLRALTLDDGLLKQLEMWISGANNPKLVIIDTLELIKGKASRNESAYSADYRFMRPLHDLALEKGIAILCVTHTRKSTGFALDDVFDQIIGSTAQMGGSDASWIISGKRGEDRKTFTATGRDFESVEFTIERGAGGRWIFQGSAEDAQEKRQQTEYQDDPVVKVIRQQLTGSGGSWSATAQNVLEEVAKASGSYPVPDAIRMSKRLRELAPMLLEYDGIIVHLPDKYGGTKGRKFKFEQIPFTK